MQIHSGHIAMHSSVRIPAHRNSHPMARRPINRTETREALKSAQWDWLQAVKARTGWTPTRIARESGLTPTTILRFDNRDPKYPNALSAQTISQIAQGTGVAATAELLGEHAVSPPMQLREGEAAPYRAEASDPLESAIKAMTNGRNGLDPWVLRSAALVEAGYLPGDVLMVDLNLEPRPGDVVCAQLYRWAEKKAETVFRLFEAPSFLLAASRDPALRKPVMVDDDNTVIKGVVTCMLRRRAA
jgi:transcriptional regulator with XRE-family HTH domain